MNKKKASTLTVVLAIVLIFVILLSGCAQTAAPEPSATASPSEAASESAASASASAAESATAETAEVTDMAGRKVTVPTTVNKVYNAAPTSEAATIALAPEKLAGWVNKPAEKVLKYLPEYTASLPVLGGWMGEKSTANIEEIIKTAPDLIIFMTSETTNPASGTLADTIQQKTNIPVVVLDSSFKKIPESLKMMGDLLGAQDKAAKLIDYYDQKITPLMSKLSSISGADKKSIYYAESATGLQTDPSGNTHAELIDFINATNIADVQVKSGMGLSDVSMEQVLSWNPDILVIAGGGEDLYSKVFTDASWSQLDSVKNKKVAVVPSAPFNWFDRPPSLMRVLGYEWLAQQVYPEQAGINMTQETKDFYSLFFGVTLTDEQVSELLANSFEK